MAHFHKLHTGSDAAFDPKIPRQTLAPGSTTDIALWGGGPAGEELIVFVTNPMVASVTESNISAGLHERVFRLVGRSAGTTALEARMPDRTSLPSALKPKTSAGAVWASCQIEIKLPTAPVPNSAGEELIPEMGADAACRSEAAYIDNVQTGSLDLISNTFTVKHVDGSEIELDIGRILREGKEPHMVYVYYRDTKNNKIYPRVWDKNTAPNILHMATEIEEAYTGAKLLNALGGVLLEINPNGRPPAFKGFVRNAGKAKVPYKAAAQLVLDEEKLKVEVIKRWSKDGGNSLIKVVSKARGAQTTVRGYITQEKFIKGRTPEQIEKILGLKAGDLAEGCHVSRLSRLPQAGEFELRSYTNLPDGKPFVGGDYPPGLGAPQWQLIKEIPAAILKFVSPGQTF